MKDLQVLLDNGHGKETAGKRSPVWSDGTQLYEWQFNRIIAIELERQLLELGIPCKRIVTEDTDVSLSERAVRVNKEHAKKKSIFISIHANAGGGHGWEVWTTERKNESDKLAQCFLDVFPKIFPDKKLRGAKEKNFTVINKTNCCSILTESFFYDSEDECKWMMTDDAIQRIVKLHVEAIKKYLEYTEEDYQNSPKMKKILAENLVEHKCNLV